MHAVHTSQMLQALVRDYGPTFEGIHRQSIKRPLPVTGSSLCHTSCSRIISTRDSYTVPVPYYSDFMLAFQYLFYCVRTQTLCSSATELGGG